MGKGAESTGLRVNLVDSMNEFQKMVYLITRHLRSQGYDSDGVSNDRVARAISVVPAIRQLANRQGYEWSLPPEEVARIAEVVRQNMTFQERPHYVYNDLETIEIELCEHGKLLRCDTCRREGGRYAPDGGVY